MLKNSRLYNMLAFKAQIYLWCFELEGTKEILLFLFVLERNRIVNSAVNIIVTLWTRDAVCSAGSLTC